ncbi:MAG: Gfo/Idh/MocA family oxidoreductase [Pseudomonadota bacterium]
MAGKTIQELGALVIGLGSIGARHLANLRSLGLTRLGVLRAHGRGPLPPGADLTGAAVHTDLGEALAQGYDLAVIANPTHLHLDCALAAARAGCHVYMEKPLSDRLEDADALAGLVDAAGLKFQMGCQMRFHPGLVAVKGWLNGARVGRPLRAVVEVGQYLPDWQPWRDYRTSYAARADMGGGVVLTLIHELDYTRWLLGGLTPLAALGGRSGALDLSAEDHATCLLRGPGGAAVVIGLDYLQRPPCRRMKILGSHGVIAWDYFAGQAELIVDGEKAASAAPPAGWQANDMYLDLTRDLLRAIVEDRPTAVPLAEGLAALRLALALREGLQVALKSGLPGMLKV